MAESTSSALDGTVDAYCKVWCEPDPASRRRQLASIWAPEGTYADPTVHAAGCEELLAHIAAVMARRPGARVERTSQVDGHHGYARFAWHVVLADGSSLPEGIDFVQLDADGKIQSVVGFFGPLARPAG